jgi:hypothetical protein
MVGGMIRGDVYRELEFWDFLIFCTDVYAND